MSTLLSPLRGVVVATLLSAATGAGCADCSKGGGEPAPDAANAAATMDAEAREAGVINVTPVPTAAVMDMLNPEKLPPYAGPTGSVEGTITVTGDHPFPATGDFSKCLDAEKAWGRAFREGPPVGDKGARALADAVVVVTGYHGFFVPEKAEAKEVRIEGCAYTSLTATMTFGQRIEVKNLSTTFWTPMLEPGANLVMMMATPNGDPAKIYPKKPGHYLLMDRDRKYAVVDVYTFLHPLHASTDLLGHYRIDGLPVGKLTVSTMHPRIGTTAESELVVQAGVVAKVDLNLKNVNKDAGAPLEAGADSGVFHPVLH
ncbi:MAG TPA: hypothetical protein VLT33_50805 [Labilithrix sp.]|nr:hypothetical protein [Labilithrix sp.]